jgi:hypothetical protein
MRTTETGMCGRIETPSEATIVLPALADARSHSELLDIAAVSETGSGFGLRGGYTAPTSGGVDGEDLC